MNKFKVGDRVKVKNVPVGTDSRDGGYTFTEGMCEFIGNTYTVRSVENMTTVYTTTLDSEDEPIRFGFDTDWLELVSPTEETDNENIVDALSMAFGEADEEDDMDNNTITLAQVVVSAANNTNDHIEIDIDNTDITVKQVMKMCEEIEESLDSGNSVVLELWNEPKMAKSGYTASVYEVNNKYIDDGRRLLCSFNNIVI